MSFVKVPVVLLPLSEQSIESLPESIWYKLGSLDEATYPEDMLQRCIGGAICLQVKDGEPDFYPITANNYMEYKSMPLEDVARQNEPLYSFLVSYFDGPLEEQLPGVIGGIKEMSVTMVRLSELNIDLGEDSPTEVEAPWGGAQIVPPGKDAFVAVPHFGRENSLISQVYIVQEDAQRNPAQYIPAPATPASVHN